MRPRFFGRDGSESVTDAIAAFVQAITSLRRLSTPGRSFTWPPTSRRSSPESRFPSTVVTSPDNDRQNPVASRGGQADPVELSRVDNVLETWPCFRNSIDLSGMRCVGYVLYVTRDVRRDTWFPRWVGRLGDAVVVALSARCPGLAPVSLATCS